MLAESDAKRAIIEWLCQPSGRLVTQRTLPGGWKSESRVGGGAEADQSTVRFLKARRLGARELHAVEFRTIEGRNRACVVGVIQSSAGKWDVSGMAGGSGSDPPRDHPWLNLGAWGWPDHGFCGGGKVIGTGREAAGRVRLRFKNGVELEDTVDDGLVLFMTDRVVQVPTSVGILDGGGLILASHPAL